jgi:hypothetical membrane protein
VIRSKQVLIGAIGITSVVILVLSLLVFGVLNPEFSFLNDFISKLGAKGEPNAFWFNTFGFSLVGVSLSIFGYGYGKLLADPPLSVLLALFGLGFAFTAFPMDMQMESAPISKAHIVAICFGLAFWLFGLSRLGANKRFKKKVRIRANVAATILMASMIGFVLDLWSMPITHRLVFTVVFGWTAITSMELLKSDKSDILKEKKTLDELEAS